MCPTDAPTSVPIAVSRAAGRRSAAWSATGAAALALLLALGTAGCVQAPIGVAPLAFDGPAWPMRGDARKGEEESPPARTERMPSVEPPPLGGSLRCGGSRGEQARAQCLRDGPAGSP